MLCRDLLWSPIVSHELPCQVLRELKRARALQKQLDQKQQAIFVKAVGAGELL